MAYNSIDRIPRKDVDYWLTDHAAVHRNLLDNPFFTLNTRAIDGTTGVSTGDAIMWTVDRWKMINGTLKVKDGYVNYSSGPQENTRKFYQSIQTNVNIGDELTVTLHCRINSISGTWWIDQYGGSTSAETSVYEIIKLPSSPGEYWIEQTFNANSKHSNPSIPFGIGLFTVSSGERSIDIDLYSMKLERGNYSTLKMDYPPDPYMEYLKCQSSAVDKEPGVRTFNQLIITNPFMTGTSSTLGAMVTLRASATIQENGSVKIERSSTNSTKSYGAYFQIENYSSADLTGHKIYYRISGIDISGATHFSWLLFNLTYSSTSTVSQTITGDVPSVVQGILTPPSNVNRFVFWLHPGDTVENGEYYNIDSIQVIDLTAMFGAGYEPTAEEFYSVYGGGMPYSYIKGPANNELRENRALIRMAQRRDISDMLSYDPEERELYRQDVLSCAASYLVNEKNCTCVVGTPSNISDTPFVALYDKQKGYENMYIDDGRDYLKFVYTDTQEFNGVEYPVVYLDCTAFCGLLTKCIPYEESPMYYAFTHLNNINYDTMFSLGFNNGGIDTKPYTFDLHQYNSKPTAETAFFANHSGNRLYKLWDGASQTFDTKVFNALETGDILYIGYSNGDSYRGIGHIQVFLKTLDELNLYGKAYGVSFKSSEKFDADTVGAHGYVIEVGGEYDGVDCIRVVSLDSWIAKVSSIKAIYMHKANVTPFNSTKASNYTFNVINHTLYL